MGRLLAAHWPALIAWFFAGILGRCLAVEGARFVGAYTAIGGFLLLPLASLARLISFVAMFLVLAFAGRWAWKRWAAAFRRSQEAVTGPSIRSEGAGRARRAPRLPGRWRVR
jgi:hypothetical protein